MTLLLHVFYNALIHLVIIELEDMSYKSCLKNYYGDLIITIRHLQKLIIWINNAKQHSNNPEIKFVHDALPK